MKVIALSFILLPLFIISQKIGDSLDFELYSSSHYYGKISKIEDDGYFIKIKNNREIYLSFSEIKSSVKISKTSTNKTTSITKEVDSNQQLVPINELIIGDEIEVLLKAGQRHKGSLYLVETEKLVIKSSDSIFKIFFYSQIQETFLINTINLVNIDKEKADTTNKLSHYAICNCGKSDAKSHGKKLPFFLAGSSLVLSWFPVFSLEKKITPILKYSPDFKDVTASKNSYLHNNDVYLRCYRNEVIKIWRIAKYSGLGLILFLLISAS